MQKLVWQNAEGDEIDLTSGHYGITEWEGFSGTELNIQSQQVPFQDGSVFLNGLLSERELSVTLAIDDGKNLETRYQLRRELIRILNPKLGEGYLIYTNDFISKRIKCIPQIPLFPTHNSNKAGTPKASLAWTACSPYWEDLEDTVVELEQGTLNTIVNNGDVPTQPVIRIQGEGQGAQVLNINTNKRIKCDFTITNQQIKIDTNIGKKSVIEINQGFFLKEYAGTVSDIIYYEKTGLFYGATNDNNLLYSKDLKKWESKRFVDNLKKFVYAQDKDLLCILGNNVILLSNDGENWQKVYFLSTFTPQDIVYSQSKNLFVTVGNNGNIYTSPDCITWTSRTSGVSVTLNSVTFGDGIFVAVGENGTIIASSDGITWTEKTSGVSVTLNKIESYEVGYNRGFVTVGVSGTILISSGGNVWYAQTSGTNATLKDVAITKAGEVVAVGNSGTVIYSANRSTWSLKTVDTTTDISSIYYQEEMSIFVLAGEGVFISSNDANTWDVEYFWYKDTINKVKKLAEQYIAVGTNGLILRSQDLQNWEQIESGVSASLYSITYLEEPGRYIIVGEGGLILTSDDDFETLEPYYSEASDLSDVCYADELETVFAVGNGILKSQDNGTTWEFVASGITSGTIGCIIYSKNLHCLVISGYGIYATSEDGEVWNDLVTSYAFFGNLFENEEGVFCIYQYQGYTPYLYKLTSLTDVEHIDLTNVDTYPSPIYFFYSELLENYIIIDASGRYYTTSDYNKRWNPKGEQFSFARVNCYLEDVHNLFLFGTVNTFYNSAVAQYGQKDGGNLIQTLTANSDMSFELLKGENGIRLLRESGILSATISFRQKYIGV